MLTAYDSCFDYLASNDSARRIFNSVTYTNTALDIKSTVDVLTDWTSRQEVFVMGSSNGAYLVQRYMMLAPDQADAIILDALLPPDLFRLIQNENNMNTLGLDVMGRYVDGVAAHASCPCRVLNAGWCQLLGRRFLPSPIQRHLRQWVRVRWTGSSDGDTEVGSGLRRQPVPPAAQPHVPGLCREHGEPAVRHRTTWCRAVTVRKC